MALVNAYIVYGKLTQKKLCHRATNYGEKPDWKLNNRRRNPQAFSTAKRVSGNFPTETPSYLLELKQKCGRCHYFKNQGKGNKTFVKFNTCGMLSCLVTSLSGRNCFYKHHLQA